MSKASTNGTFGLLWVLPILFIFIAGGSLQYIGLLSQTQSNWLALFLFSHVFLIRAGWMQFRYESLLIIFILITVLSYFQHDTPISYMLTYFYYIACTIIAAVAGRVYALRIASSITTESFFKVATYFLCLELIVVIFQKLFTEQFISLSQAPIGYIDAIFGTFFLQSDAALAAVCELLTISTFFLFCKVKDRFVIAVLSLAIIFLGNSSAAKFAIVLVLTLLLAHEVFIRLHINRYKLSIILAIGCACLILTIYSPLLRLLNNFFAQVTDEYYHREGWQTAARFSPLGQMLTERVNLFGYGALTYYNPITKQWLYNAGFSTIYSLYLDFGLAGLLSYNLYQFFLLIKLVRNYFEFAIFTCVFILFMTFNFALTDLTFVFSFNVILHLNYLRGRSGRDIFYRRTTVPLGAEFTNHTVPRATV
jgi:hypothetical protein